MLIFLRNGQTADGIGTVSYMLAEFQDNMTRLPYQELFVLCKIEEKAATNSLHFLFNRTSLLSGRISLLPYMSRTDPSKVLT